MKEVEGIERILPTVMQIPEESTLGEGQNWKGIKTTLIKAWLRKQEVFSSEMGRFRGARITAFKWLKNYCMDEEEKLLCRHCDRTSR